MTFDRETTLKTVRRVLVKLGSAVLAREDGRLDRALIASLAEQVAAKRRRGIDVIIVSSGAVRAGLAEMKQTARPSCVTEKQAFAAIGQGQLMRQYSDAFAVHDLHVAQVLLSRGDLDDRQRYLNARNTLLRLLAMGVVPIINENDTTAIEELTFGDNDVLSAAVATKVEADLLVLLTVVNGLRDEKGEVIPTVERVDEDIIALVRDERTPYGRGGMEAKLTAVKNATTGGVAAVIANGKERRVLERLFEGEELGTWFVPSEQRLAGRKNWIAFGKAHGGNFVRVDDGAVRALREKGKSLLPIGVVEVGGEFEKGDVVEIRDSKGDVIGRGLINYPSDDMKKILGLKTDEIAECLGSATHDEAIHRDNLIVYR